MMIKSSKLPKAKKGAKGGARKATIKAYAGGGMVRGTGAATKGKKFSGCY